MHLPKVKPSHTSVAGLELTPLAVKHAP